MPTTGQTFRDLVQQRAAEAPDKRAYAFLGDGDEISASLTYAALDARARAVADRLQDVAAPGDRALLLFQPGLDFACAFLGCLYAGVVAVPAYPPHPTRLDKTLPRLLAIAADAMPCAVLTGARLLDQLAKSRPLPDPLERLDWIAVDALENGDGWRPRPLAPDALAFLQYTSGSTSEPKGVMVSHANLLHNEGLLQRLWRNDASSVVVGWLPLYHDMGLIGNLLHPVFVGATCILMPPLAFLQQPVRWLRAVTRFRATTSGGPNFAYELCAKKISPEQRESLDLRTWRVAFNGAEPVRRETLDRFAETFAASGFDRRAFVPCYGLAEVTLYATGDLHTGAYPESRAFDARGLAEGRALDAVAAPARELVDCGGIAGEQSVVIADPETADVCPERRVGEIWVSGDSVAQGYWNQPAATASTFGARLADGRGPFLRTGDLGFVVDGRLFVAGRRKDLIVIRGQNYYPQDVELSAERSHPAIVTAGTAAFSVEMDGEEQLIVLVEVNRRHRDGQGRPPDVDAVLTAVRLAITEEHQLQARAIVALDMGAIPKTSSGKVRRHLCRQRFIDGALEPIVEWRAERPAATAPARAASAPSAGDTTTHAGPPVEEIEAWLVARLSERLQVAAEALNRDEPFASYGLDSREAAQLSGNLEDWLGRRLSPTLAYEYPTVRKLAHHLAGAASIKRAAGPGTLADDEPIAIVGIGCRFPGADNVSAFWSLLRHGVDAIGEVPADRWPIDELYDPDRNAAGKMTTRWGGFLDGVDQFEPQFFGISPREAARMDPQQRIVLEVAWAALEDAGETRDRTAGTRTGVFLGISTSDYSRLQADDTEAIDAYTGTGSALSIAANRLSYLMDWRGPSLAVDTACSSSLVAVHLACQSLRSGESELALAGGVNLILAPDITVNFSRAGVMAPDGRCKAFDAEANGYVRSEGAGIVVLKPLSRAAADGDPIYAVIRGSAVGQDGRTNGLMAPSREAQEDVLRRAYASAGLAPGRATYVEAHGTGTFLGDPIEAAALGAVMGEGRTEGDRCAVGSVKTNIGHAEAAAGVAGLIKVALALHHGELPASLHFHRANPHIDFDALPLRVQAERAAWPTAGAPRVAGVSSFGFGGVNSHIVLEERPAGRAAPPPLDEPSLLLVSGHNGDTLRDMAVAFRKELADGSLARVPLADICGAAALRVHHHDHRLALVGRTHADLVDRLAAFLDGEARPGLVSGRAGTRHQKVVFVFPGQGSQWPGMGRELYARHEAFGHSLEAAAAAVSRCSGLRVLDVLLRDDPAHALDGIDVIQPVLFAIEVALAAVWRSWGIEPAAVVGHSMGEIAAAHVAGVLTIDDAAAIVCRRSRLMRGLSGTGAMAVVELSREDAESAIAAASGALSIAVCNSPRSTVIAGNPDALAEVMADLEARDVYCSLVKVDVASHSAQMDPLRQPLLEQLTGLAPRATAVPMLSTVTGAWLDGTNAGADYWVDNLRRPVLFGQALTQLIEQGHDTFIEVSPHPILLMAIEEARRPAGRGNHFALPSMRRNDEDAILASVGALYVAGFPVKWPALLHPPAGRPVPLPSYRWQRSRHWFEDAGTRRSVTPAGRAKNPHALGQPTVSALHPSASTWDVALSPARTKFLVDHKVRGSIVVPATVYADYAWQAASHLAPPDTQIELEALEFLEILHLDADRDTDCQIVAVREDDGTASFQFFSRDTGGDGRVHWKRHARGLLRFHPAGDIPAYVAGETPADIAARCSTAIDGARLYESLRTRGLEYGPAFALLESVRHGEDEAIGALQSSSAPSQHLHPATVDAGLHAVAAAAGGSDSHTYVPVRFDSVLFYGGGEGPLWSHARIRAGAPGGDRLVADVAFITADGRVVQEARGVIVQRVGEPRRASTDPARWFYEIAWEPRPLGTRDVGAAPAQEERQPWLILADSGGGAEALAAQLTARGETCVLVPVGTSIGAQLTDAASRGAGYAGIVHMWAIDFDAVDPTAAELHEAQHVVCGTVWEIVQAIAALDLDVPPRLWLVTSGAVTIDGQQEPATLAQTTLWGLGNTAAHEHPELRCTRVDVSDLATSEEVAALADELLGDEPDDRIALRDDRRFVARLVPATPPLRVLRYRKSVLQERRAIARMHGNGTYLVTGGLGGLGLAVARWLSVRGAGHIVLMGRSAPSPEAEAAIASMREAGTGVTVARGDVADRARLLEILSEIDRTLPPLRGVMHAAGVLDDGLLLHMDWPRFEKTLAPKLDGGWHLHELTLDHPLDFFVLFSSVASVLGSPGQANYAAANGFLDGLAHYRRALGLPSLSINWGPWEQVGLAATQPERARRAAELSGAAPQPADERPLLDRLALRGLESFSPEAGIHMLEQLMLRPAAQVAVVPLEWQQFSTFYPGFRSLPAFSLLHGLAGSGTTEAAAVRQGAVSTDNWLTGVPPERWQATIEDRLQEHVGRTLGLPVASIDRQQPLTGMGLDSLMAVELKNAVDAHLGVTIPVRRFLKGPSIAEFAAELRAELASRAGAAAREGAC